MAEDYKVGQELMYSEDNARLRVKVLEVKGNQEYEGYKLQILEVINHHFLGEKLNNGDIFNCDRLRNMGYPGVVWNLEEMVNV